MQIYLQRSDLETSTMSCTQRFERYVSWRNSSHHLSESVKNQFLIVLLFTSQEALLLGWVEDLGPYWALALPRTKNQKGLRPNQVVKKGAYTTDRRFWDQERSPKPWLLRIPSFSDEYIIHNLSRTNPLDTAYLATLTFRPRRPQDENNWWPPHSVCSTSSHNRMEQTQRSAQLWGNTMELRWHKKQWGSYPRFQNTFINITPLKAWQRLLRVSYRLGIE